MNKANEKVDTLIEEFLLIKKGYEELLSDNNRVFSEAQREIIRTLEEKRGNAFKYKQNEVLATQKIYDGRMYVIENDTMRSIETIHERCRDLISHKYHRIAELFPDVASIFERANIEFIKQIKKRDNEKKRDILSQFEIDFTQDSLLPKEKVEEQLNELESHDETFYIIKESTLYHGTDHFQSGSLVNIQNGNEVQRPGIIHLVVEDGIEFVASNYGLVKIPLLALNLGICSIMKQ